MPTLQAGQFVHLVASVDLEYGTGKILYVNPSTIGTGQDASAAADASDAAPESGFEVVVQDRSGTELHRFSPSIQVSSCDHGDAPKTGLIDEDLPFVAGMSRLILLHGVHEVSTFEAGERLPSSSRAAGPSPLVMGAAPSASPNRRTLSAMGAVPPQVGVSYTVQVKPEGTSAWQTIALGRSTPAVEIDRNQFPGVAAARVRILRSTGFEDEILAEDDLDLTD